jgi:hypothetical protein
LPELLEPVSASTVDGTRVDRLELPASLPALVASDRVDLRAAMLASNHFAGVSNMVARHDYAVDSIDLDFA